MKVGDLVRYRGAWGAKDFRNFGIVVEEHRSTFQIRIIVPGKDDLFNPDTWWDRSYWDLMNERR